MSAFAKIVFALAMGSFEILWSVGAHHCHLDAVPSPTGVTMDDCYVGYPCVLEQGGTAIGALDLYMKAPENCGGKGCCTTLRDCTLEDSSGTVPSHITVTTDSSGFTTVTSTIEDTTVYYFSCKAGLAPNWDNWVPSDSAEVSNVPITFAILTPPAFADTSILSSTQYSMTEFSTSLFTTTPASGVAVTYAISSVSGSVTAPSGLNAMNVGDGSNIKITPTDTTSSGWMMY